MRAGYTRQLFLQARAEIEAPAKKDMLSTFTAAVNMRTSKSFRER